MKELEPFGYYPCHHTDGLWSHRWRPVIFTLVVDDFGVSYKGKHHAEYLIQTFQKLYPLVSVNWQGYIYCGIQIQWDYANKQTCYPNNSKLHYTGINEIWAQKTKSTPTFTISTQENCVWQKGPRGHTRGHIPHSGCKEQNKNSENHRFLALLCKSYRSYTIISTKYTIQITEQPY